jgi:hypothetical protein
MSLILDALRKLDLEKSSLRNRTVNIAAEILSPPLPPPRRKMWIYFTAIFLTAVATAAITYAVISKTPPPAAIKPTASNPRVTPDPVSHASVRDTRDKVIPDSAIIKAPLKSTKPVEAKKPAESKTPAESNKQPVEVKIPALSPSQETVSPEVVREEAPVVPQDVRKPPEQTERKPAVTPASLRLSGIVWSEEPSKRLAVINGTVTTEGYVFEGMKVVEIHPDHVLLLLNDQPFKLSLNK